MSWVFGQAQGKQPIRTYGSKKAVAPSTTRPATGLSSFRSAAGDMGIQVHANSPGLDDSMGSPLLTAPTKRPGALGDLDHNLLDPHGEARRNGPKRKKSSEPAGLETQLKKFHKMVKKANPHPFVVVWSSPTCLLVCQCAKPSPLCTDSSNLDTILAPRFRPHPSPSRASAHPPSTAALRPACPSAAPRSSLCGTCWAGRIQRT